MGREENLVDAHGKSAIEVEYALYLLLIGSNVCISGVRALERFFSNMRIYVGKHGFPITHAYSQL